MSKKYYKLNDARFVIATSSVPQVGYILLPTCPCVDCYYYDGEEWVCDTTKQDTIANNARVIELQEYLSSTDWYAIRLSDSGEAIPDDVKQARTDARAEISNLRGE